MHGSGSNKEIFECNGDALGSSFAFDSSRASGNFDGNWMNRNVPDELIHESLPPRTALFIFGSLYTVNNSTMVTTDRPISISPWAD